MTLINWFFLVNQKQSTTNNSSKSHTQSFKIKLQSLSVIEFNSNKAYSKYGCVEMYEI